jgi:hypothetical protein
MFQNADPQEGRKPAFNAQQLEECDMFPEDSSFICCLDGETHSQTQQVHVLAYTADPWAGMC